MRQLFGKIFFAGLITSMTCLGLVWASIPDSVNLAPRAAGPLDCGRGKSRTPISVSFRTLVVPGRKSVVTYRRHSLTADLLTSAVNRTLLLSAKDVVECARKSALADMAAFSFEGNCTAFTFREKLCNCLWGAKVIYLTDSSITPPKFVNSSAAPYINTTLGGVSAKQYNLLGFLLEEVSNNNVFQLKDENEAVDFVADSHAYIVPHEDGGYTGVYFFYFDLDSCLIDISCGRHVLLVAKYDSVVHHVLTECGKIIQVPADLSSALVLYSHPGVGCRPFPDGPHYNCTVTLTSVKTMSISFENVDFMGATGTCDGYTLSVRHNPNGAPIEKKLCLEDFSGGDGDDIAVTLSGTATNKTAKLGFLFRIWIA
ncbi:uncharacterized protein LOC108673846 [Hyalella azteca]|uniref:Uncharacterized protein LOC108673846 n=1 Tax=Hyalella azteca TaxID=294128 RepID=A0A8B7NU15_HYAAZ|nr:uncharacterized protein LOC108673846 [Hyalella azteca]